MKRVYKHPTIGDPRSPFKKKSNAANVEHLLFLQVLRIWLEKKIIFGKCSLILSTPLKTRLFWVKVQAKAHTRPLPTTAR